MATMGSKSMRTYRWAWWTILLNFATSLYMLLGLALIISILGLVIFTAFQGAKTNWIGIIVLVTLGPFVLLFVVFFVWFLIFPLGRFFFSYLRTSQTGIEYRYWPTYGARCAWDQVDRLGKYKSVGFIPYDVLYLKSAEPIGWPLMTTIRRKLGLKTQYLVPLTGIHGWPNGELADELRYRAPQLFNQAGTNRQGVSYL